jgi:hypothetical protein
MNKWGVWAYDVQQAFLEAERPVDKPLWASYPSGYDEPPGEDGAIRSSGGGTRRRTRCLLVLRQLYGLHDAPMGFFKVLSEHLVKDQGFTQLYNRISVIPQTSTTILPLVGIGGSMLVWWNHVKTDKFFVELSGGIIWWDQPSSPARPPTRPWPPHPARCPAPSAAATLRRTAELHSPPARSVSLPQVNGQKTVQLNGILSVLTSFSSFR